MANLPEVWLRGPVTEVPPLLQPVAHALLQAREEINKLMNDFPQNLLWEKPAGMASPGFHLQHLKGVLDRLFTYAKGKNLSPDQFEYLRQESTQNDRTVQELLHSFSKQVGKALEQLQDEEEKTLTQFRGVGRAQLPSTVLGLYFHGAEHTMRHLGQLLVTVGVLKKTSIKNEK